MTTLIEMHGELTDRDTLPCPRAARGRSLLRDVVQIVRPQHWVKNVFVIAPLLFGGLPTWQAVLRAAWAFGCFCILASGIYCLNDVIDAPTDRQHPRKRRRPVASGAIPAPSRSPLQSC